MFSNISRLIGPGSKQSCRANLKVGPEWFFFGLIPRKVQGTHKLAFCCPWSFDLEYNTKLKPWPQKPSDFVVKRERESVRESQATEFLGYLWRKSIESWWALLKFQYAKASSNGKMLHSLKVPPSSHSPRSIHICPFFPPKLTTSSRPTLKPTKPRYLNKNPDSGFAVTIFHSAHEFL